MEDLRHDAKIIKNPYLALENTASLLVDRDRYAILPHPMLNQVLLAVSFPTFLKFIEIVFVELDVIEKALG